DDLHRQIGRWLAGKREVPARCHRFDLHTVRDQAAEQPDRAAAGCASLRQRRLGQDDQDLQLAPPRAGRPANSRTARPTRPPARSPTAASSQSASSSGSTRRNLPSAAKTTAPDNSPATSPPAPPTA